MPASEAHCRFARRVAPSNTYEDDRLGYDSLHDKVTKAWAKNRAIVVGIEPKTRSTPPPYPRTRVAGYLILAKNATPDLQRTFPRTDHNSLLFCEFDRGLYARSCPLCEIPLVGNYRCDNCSGGRVARSVERLCAQSCSVRAGRRYPVGGVRLVLRRSASPFNVIWGAASNTAHIQRIACSA